MTLPPYLFRLALVPTLVAMGLMLAIIWLLQSLRFLDFVINKGLGLGTFFYLTTLLIPSLLTIVLPLAVFAGVAYALKYLGDESELTALFATGWSRCWVLTPTLFLAVLAVAMGYVLHMGLLPASTTAFKNLQYSIRSGQSDLLLDEATFNQLGNGLMVYLDERTGPTSFARLLVHDTRKPEAPATWLASEGRLVIENGQPRLILKHGMQQTITPNRTEILTFDEHNLDLISQLTQPHMQTRAPELEEYSLYQLWHAQGARNAGHAQQMRAEASRRLLWPLAPLPLVLWAAAWLLQVPGRGSNMAKLAMASAGAIGYVAALLALRGIAETNFTVMMLQPLLPLGFMGFAIWKIRRLAHG